MPTRLYEMMYILRPDVIDDELQGTMGRVANVVTQHGGEIDLHEIWDRRDLAYEIDGCLRGTYCIMYFNADTQIIENVRREMELNEQVLRYLIVLPEPRAIWRPRGEDVPEEESPFEVEDEEMEEEWEEEGTELGGEGLEDSDEEEIEEFAEEVEPTDG
ncbi:MAG: 30S ribosomal protein S6 [Candidatus Zipacnadales bacterium]